MRSWGWRLVWWESNNKEEKPNNTKCKTPFKGLLVRQCQGKLLIKKTINLDLIVRLDWNSMKIFCTLVLSSEVRKVLKLDPKNFIFLFFLAIFRF